MAGDHTEERRKILEILDRADEYRKHTLNLQASENVVSSDVRRALASDLASRYSHLEPSGHNSYGGTGYAEEILETAESLAREVYGSEYAEVRPTGGHIAVLASILASCEKGDSIMTIGAANGGYPGYTQPYVPDMLSLKNAEIPYEEETQEIDYSGFSETARKVRPAAIILGQSAFVRPYDLKRVREIADDAGGRTSLIYDGSHVMGLIAGKTFQKDVLDYADILLGSTHKSLFGPQGGIMLTNDRGRAVRLREQLVWKTMDNYHPNRVAALALALAEMKETGEEYAGRVVRNSAELGAELDREGLGIRFRPWYSYSHQILLDREKLSEKGFNPLSFSTRMEENGIILDRDGRIGTSEISHLGITDMKGVARLVLDAASGNNVRGRVEDMVLKARKL